MKKNLPLYILLVFLIVVNGFFLYNYLSPTTSKSNESVKGSGSGGPMEFIVKALKFDDEQMKQFEKINNGHHERMIKSSEETRFFKDQLGRLIIKDNVSEAEVDSVLNLMGEKEMAHEKLMFNHLRAIRNICTEPQKQRFEQIIRDALRGGPGGKRQGGGGPPPDTMGEGGPPPGNMRDGGPPPDDMPEGMPPPRPE
ncbi:Spy/CpxP family protein refolding chaperone [Mariniflexile aquimaris]|uniref:Spy/CpxP family protein refolding chaperone n=1 Tax=Mariniflexile aquimaris TaxID=881009 RepID=A0ABW3BV75_9FLAO